MSEQIFPKDNLAQVLNRINTLTKQHETAIPVLTEVFEGDFAKTTSDEIPILSQTVDSDLAKQIYQKTINSILRELQPQIKLAIEHAVKRELSKSNVAVSASVEAELLEVLRKRLERD